MERSRTRRASWTRCVTASVWRIENFCRALVRPQVKGVLADHANRGGGRDHGRRAVMAVHQQHVWAHVVAPDLDVIGQRCEHPYPATAVQAAGRLEVDRAAEQLVDERKRFVVLHDPVALADDAKHLIIVLPDSGVMTSEAPIAQYIGQVSTAVDRQAPLCDAPAETRRLDRLTDCRRRPIEYGTEAVPGRLAHREHGVRICESCRHFEPPLAVKPRSVRGRSQPRPHPLWGCENGRASRLPLQALSHRARYRDALPGASTVGAFSRRQARD